MTTYQSPPHYHPVELSELPDCPHDWKVTMTHSLLPAGDGITYECKTCGAVKEIMTTITCWMPNAAP